MSRLKLFCPDDAPIGLLECDEPVLLSFAEHAKRAKVIPIESAARRARVIRGSSDCPYCEHPAAIPIEIGHARRTAKGYPMPGTGTLVGFHCDGCHAEWRA